MSAGRHSRTRAVVACVLGAIVLCLVVTSESGLVFISPNADFGSGDGGGEPARSASGDNWDFWTSAGDPQVMTTWFGVTLAIFITAIVLAGVLVAVRWVVGVLRQRRDELTDLRSEDAREWNRVQAVDAVDEATREALELVAEGRAGDAVTAYWQALQMAAAAAGLPRETWQTSSEYVQQLVAELGVSAEAASTLATAFRTVRFSGHSLEPGDVEQAREALEQIRRDLAGKSAASGVAS